MATRDRLVIDGERVAGADGSRTAQRGKRPDRWTALIGADVDELGLPETRFGGYEQSGVRKAPRMEALDHYAEPTGASTSTEA